MKYTVRQYGEALVDSLDKTSPKEQKKMMGNFLRMVQRNGDSPRLSMIVRAFEKEYMRRHALRKVSIETVSPLTESIKKEIKRILGGEIVLVESENLELGAGMRITVDEELFIDASAKGQLERLFKK